MKNKAIYFIILLVTLVLFAGFYFVNRGAVLHKDDLPLDAIAPNISSFQSYSRAKVTAINTEDDEQVASLRRIVQNVTIRFLTGDNKDKEVLLDYESGFAAQKLKANDTVVIGTMLAPQDVNQSQFVILEEYRLPKVGIVAALFLLLAVIFGRLKGFTAVVGLGFSIIVLVYFIAPGILAGQNPVIITLLGSGIIALVSIFLAHGFNQRTALAVISTLISIGLAQVIAYYAVRFVGLLGNGSEETFLLQVGSLGAFNLQGLLLGSIIIGTLGILDDVTTGQTAAVHELHQVNPELSFRQLYDKAMSIGREHIASLINTLVLAYAGAFFPLFLLIVLNNTQPLWTTLNSEFISEEIIRTLVGSMVLILAVPLSTLLASFYLKNKKSH